MVSKQYMIDMRNKYKVVKFKGQLSALKSCKHRVRKNVPPFSMYCTHPYPVFYTRCCLQDLNP